MWQDRDITLERTQKGKIPFGNFRAYETETGVPVEELTADNCGYMLLGVEREVFTRAGFLRFSDLPVVDGEALRRRLNALVTTADESDASDQLAEKLRKLKNACKHNNTGLIPQVQAQQREITDKLEQLDTLSAQIQELDQRKQQLQEYAGQLENHRVALEYARCQQTREHMEKARLEMENARQALEQLELQCVAMPIEQTARQELERLDQLDGQWLALEQAERECAPMPEPPVVPEPFRGLDPNGASSTVSVELNAYRRLGHPASKGWLISGILLLAAGIGLFWLHWLAGTATAVLGLILVLVYVVNQSAHKVFIEDLLRRYGTADPVELEQMVNRYRQETMEHMMLAKQAEDQRALLRRRRSELDITTRMLVGDKSRQQARQDWQQVLQLRQQLNQARDRYEQARNHASTLDAVVMVAQPPKEPDLLTLSPQQTADAAAQTQTQLLQVLEQRTRCRTRMDHLGDRTALEQTLAQVQQRLQRLEDYYAALTLAQDTLTQAATELQRRFAPVISNRARELFAQFTGGRYDRLLLSSDLSVDVAAVDEDTTHGVLWRSDGTADALYLALRLAVAEELTPSAPLVLDDALVRLDDTRLEAAMACLRQYAETKQVILFTCQERETKFQ